MGKFKDLTGMRFGRLTVIERAENKGRNVCWKCRCDCGKICVTKSSNLLIGDTKSCGCLHAERAGKMNFSHGFTGTKIYRTWKNMKSRCLNPNVINYSNYGGRGITIYPEWIHDFQAFYDYVSRLEHFGEKGYSLDRINNNGNYEPDNVRWADRKTQNLNTRQNHAVEYDGKKMTLKEMSEKSGVGYDLLRNRLSAGDTGDRLFRPVDGSKRINNIIVKYNGESMILAEAAKKSGIDYSVLYKRYKSGDKDNTLFRPVLKNHR